MQEIPRRRLRAAAALAALILTVAGCAAGPSQTAAPARPNDVEHVVVVSVDGLIPEAIRRLGPAGAPTFHRLMVEGASTLNARTVPEATQTLPDHTSMITGRPVRGGAGHRVSINEDDGNTVHTAAGTYCAGIFDMVHDANGSTALYTGKTKFAFFDRSWDEAHGADDITGRDNGHDKIDTYLRAGDTATTDALHTALTDEPAAFSLIHYSGADDVGRAEGFLSGAYLREVTATDGLIGGLLDTIAGEATLAASTVVVVTSAHGGRGTGHGDPTLPENYTVPFFAWGAGVAAGADLYALNPDRADPGTSQPNYSALTGPVRNAEVGNLAADLLGIDSIPGSIINADQSLDLN